MGTLAGVGAYGASTIGSNNEEVAEASRQLDDERVQEAVAMISKSEQSNGQRINPKAMYSILKERGYTDQEIQSVIQVMENYHMQTDKMSMR